MNSKDYYQILGVNRDSTQGDIKKAFRSLALRYHPDRNPQNTGEAEKQFKEINEAYEVLGDERKRQIYDLTGSVRIGVMFRGRGCGRGSGRRWESID